MRRRDFLKAAAAGTVLTSSPASAQGTATTEQQAAFNAPLQIIQPPYAVPPELQNRPGVPRGQVLTLDMNESIRFPGATRTISVYVPAQYRALQPACVMVMLDNLMVSPTICDNLIHQKEMPVTIGIGVQSGSLAAAIPGTSARSNRSFEFDSITLQLAEFIEHEVLPFVQQHKTPDGLPILLSSNPDDRAITGGSTGAIGAFNAAWQRPDLFHRVFAWSTTMVGMRGADEYITLVRKTEPKPLRIFVLDGYRDEWWGGPQFGDWWLANLALQRALAYAGYAVNHVWGDWGHCDAPSINFFPQAVRWLWKNWPAPIKAGLPGNSVISEIVVPGEGWTRKWACQRAEPSEVRTNSRISNPQIASTAADSVGKVYLLLPAEGAVFTVNNDGSRNEVVKVHPSSSCIAFGHDDELYVSEPDLRRVIAVDVAGKVRTIAQGVRFCSIAARQDGFYGIESIASDEGGSKIWLVDRQGRQKVVMQSRAPFACAGVTWDGGWLFAAERGSHKAWSYRIMPDGALSDGEPYYWFHQPDTLESSGIRQVCFDRNGWGYAATTMGIQVFSTAGGEGGLVWAILPLSEQSIVGVCFGGEGRQTLYACTGDKLYARKVKATGA